MVAEGGAAAYAAAYGVVPKWLVLQRRLMRRASCPDRCGARDVVCLVPACALYGACAWQRGRCREAIRPARITSPRVTWHISESYRVRIDATGAARSCALKPPPRDAGAIMIHDSTDA